MEHCHPEFSRARATAKKVSRKDHEIGTAPGSFPRRGGAFTNYPGAANPEGAVYRRLGVALALEYITQ